MTTHDGCRADKRKARETAAYFCAGDAYGDPRVRDGFVAGRGGDPMTPTAQAEAAYAAAMADTDAALARLAEVSR